MGESVEIVKTRGGYEVLIRDEDGIGIKSWKGQAANPKAAGLLAMKYAKPFDDGPEPTFSVEMALHVVADSWEKLRPVDVERPLDGQDAERRSIMAGAIIEHRPDLRKRVLGVLAIAEVYSVFPIGLNLQHQ